MDDGHEPWTEEEIETALRDARPDIARAIHLATETGQRGSDIVRMRFSDIEEQSERPWIKVVQQKTGKRLWIPLTHDFAEELQTWERLKSLHCAKSGNLRQQQMKPDEHLEEQKASMRQIAYSDIWERAEVLWLDAGGHPGEFHAQDRQTIHEYLLAARADLDYERRAYKNPGDAAYDTLAEKKMDQE